MSSFEEARHQGFSREELAAEMAECEQRMKDLGCHKCKWGHSYSPTCERIVKGETYNIVCPYYKEADHG